MQPTDVNPWYKEPWPWFILGLLGIGVTAGSTLAFIGLSNPPEMVTGEYERLGRGLTDINVRTRQARHLGLTGAVVFDGQRLTLHLQADDIDSLPSGLLVRFEHPVTSEFDSTLLLERDASGAWIGGLEQLPHARSTIIVTDLSQTWWLAGRIDGSLGSPVEVVPRRL